MRADPNHVIAEEQRLSGINAVLLIGSLSLTAWSCIALAIRAMTISP